MTVAAALSDTYALDVQEIEKRFGAMAVLKKANLRIRPGEIHALLGSNGAGKSTLIRIVSGVMSADGGRVMVDGAQKFDPRAIAVVFQELALLPHLTVAENIGLPRRRNGLGVVRLGAQWREAADALAVIDPALARDILARPVGSLDLHQRQLVEIARALSSGARILLLDEPTANLTFAESERLFVVLRRLAKQERISILLVSHRMNEIRAVAEVCTIMRDGRTVIDRAPLATFDDGAIIEAMGQARAASVAAARVRATASSPVLSLRHGTLTVRVAPGEVLGLAGAPDGPADLMNALVGAAPSRIWELALDDAPLRFANPAAAVRSGVGYVSGDRAEKGILSTLPILDNVVAGSRVAWRRRLLRGDELRRTNDALKRLSIKAGSIDALPQTLSGGTQQKLLLARWLDTAPKILVLEEPTRGVDIGTKREIYSIIRQISDAGTIVIWWSTEFSELTEICDRVVSFDVRGAPGAVIERPGLTELALAHATGMAA